jgi:hypothetical protein
MYLSESVQVLSTETELAYTLLSTAKISDAARVSTENKIKRANPTTLQQIVKFLNDSVPHARFPFLGFNFGFGITAANKNDILNYIDLKHWYNGQLPSVRTVNVSQTTFNIDSLSINNLSINDNATWVSILIPVSAMDNDTRRQNKIKIGGTGLKTSIVNMNKTVFGYQLDYTGDRLPKGRYRLYTTFVSPTMRFNLTRAGNIFIKGVN